MQTATVAIPAAQIQKINYRIESIDLLRGMVMIIMALDHTREFFHVQANTADPLDPSTTTPFLFFTRWITHFCAPVFVFLSGTSIYLQHFRKTTQQLRSFLLKRGTWLILVEVIIMSTLFTFDLRFPVIILQVIWSIGISMIMLALLLKLPYKVILLIGLVIVFGHNLLDYLERDRTQQFSFFYNLLHKQTLYPPASGHSLWILYPFLPWTGVMFTGYGLGRLYNQDIAPAYRRKVLAILGLAIISLFIIVRSLDAYGDPLHWSFQKNSIHTVLSFLNTQKYPPSLLFICMTIGPALLFLSIMEGVKNQLSAFITVYGRVPFFYYVLHFFLIHFLCMFLFFTRGHHFREGITSGNGFPINFVVPGEGYSLSTVYLIWAGIVLFLYPLCKWFSTYRQKHDQWWLSYL